MGKLLAVSSDQRCCFADTIRGYRRSCADLSCDVLDPGQISLQLAQQLQRLSYLCDDFATSGPNIQIADTLLKTVEYITRRAEGAREIWLYDNSFRNKACFLAWSTPQGSVDK